MINQLKNMDLIYELNDVVHDHVDNCKTDYC